MTVQHFDIAILGGGNAGMTLAAKISSKTKDKKIVVFESQKANTKSATWSLWATKSEISILKPFIKGQWQKWKIVTHNSEIIHKSTEHSYIAIDSSKYLKSYERSLDKEVTLLPYHAELCSESDETIISADNKIFKSNLTFDSRPPELMRDGLKQHFIGWEIETEQDLEDIDTVTLMDFTVDQSKGIHFIYALPLSKNTILVESTMLSNHVEKDVWYESSIKEWLDIRDISIKKHLRTERGIIPMHKTKQRFSKVINIGVRGGAVRLSSGYSFSIIERQITALCEELELSDYNMPKKQLSYPLMFLDRVFNSVISEFPNKASEIFIKHASSMQGDEYAKFMRGSQNLILWLKVMLALPKFIFLKSLARVVLRNDHR